MKNKFLNIAGCLVLVLIIWIGSSILEINTCGRIDSDRQVSSINFFTVVFNA